jgi:superfamily II DNA or RNA helicase
MEKKLYEWQEKCLERWFGNHGRGMVQAVTGAGKTMLALEAVKRLDEKLSGELLVRIVVPSAGLMRQWERSLREFLEARSRRGAAPEDLRRQIGLRGGGQKSAAERKYMIYVINSARYELARQILTELREGKAVFLLADECHHYGSGQNRLIFEFYPYIKEYEKNYFAMGLSATLPAGEERSYLEAALGRRIYNYGIAEASGEQTVCQYDIYHISIAFLGEERHAYEEMTDNMARLYNKLSMLCPSMKGVSQKERFEILRNLCGGRDRRAAKMASGYMMLTYKRKRLVCLAAERMACVCELVERLGIREKIIIFGERISQADQLYRILTERYPGRVGRYHSQMGQQVNKNTLSGFGRGELRILISCKAIDEGVDVPDASVGIILSGTSRQRQRVQRLGRIIRNAEGKTRASLYYLHVEESSEDSCFLPNMGNSSIFELAYREETGGFQNPPYDEATENLLLSMREKGADSKLLEEAERCIRLGAVRADWKRQAEELEAEIEKAEGVRERNYWVCMKALCIEKND